MANTHLYPGKGRQLYRSATSNGVISEPRSFSIDDGEYSEIFDMGDGNLDVSVLIELEERGTGDVVIQILTPGLGVDDYDTIPLDGLLMAAWRNEGPMVGKFRLINNTGVLMQGAWINQVIS